MTSYGKVWDVCIECRDELNKWMKKRKAGVRMTNAEKFEEVFGFKANTKICFLPEDIGCPLYDNCDSCPYNKWLEEEYIGISPTGAEGSNKK